ncbi:hypothetical protein ACXDTH_005287 [Klebsiella variicola]|uniref:hypothetical protein n=1 Tax=Klebsiella variicola TaxID=244366 RepID=UPI0015A743D8|nr:hypothetical protein [Klebsiella variicola]
MKVAGVISGALKSSYIYLIMLENYVYIGESGCLPVVRWGSHLNKNGTFLNNLFNKQLVTMSDAANIFFVGVNCAEVEREDPFKQKIARRAIEAELHRRYLLDPNCFGPDSVLISNPPADPTRFTFSFDPKSLASNVYAEMTSRYQEWSSNSRNT